MLLDRIEQHTSRAAVVGLGYVGLPLVVTIARAGFQVVGIDLDAKKVDAVNRGESYVEDTPTEALLPFVESGQVKATTDYSVLQSVDTVNICVPTPLNKSKDPDISYIVSAVDSIAEYVHPGQLIILESTTYPGTTEEVVLPRLEASGLKAGQDFYLAFSPERIDPGNPVYHTGNTPKVLGGHTEQCAKITQRFYEQFIHKTVVVSSTRAAEMVKLMENTFRSVNIGLANEWARMCDKMGLDVWEIIDAASTKPFGFMPFYPGPGLGGHCIPVDPHYLSWKAKTYEFYARFIELASEINSSMPEFVLHKIIDALNMHQKCVRGSDVFVLGVAYKRDVGDTRESPALDVMKLLAERGASLSYHDPHVPTLVLEGYGNYESVPLTDACLAQADATIIMTDHSSLDFEGIVKQSKLVIDTRNATASVDQCREKIIKL